MSRYKDDYERITRNVIISPSGCWEWQNWINEKGYGRLVVRKRHYRAHRLAYELWVGPIPEGLELDHLCSNRACVNPEHLEPVTHTENLHRSPLTPTSINAAKTHCKWGHEFTPENTHRRSTGERSCRTCDRERRIAKQFAAANVSERAA